MKKVFTVLLIITILLAGGFFILNKIISKQKIIEKEKIGILQGDNKSQNSNSVNLNDQNNGSKGNRSGNLERKSQNAEVNNSNTRQGQKDVVKFTEEELLRSDQQGNVDVDVIFLNPLTEEKEKELVFEVMLNTHSVDLEKYDLSKISVLKTSDGIRIEDGIEWRIESGSGHHITGLLKFPLYVNNRPILSKDTDYITIIIRNLDNIPERTFQWEKDYLKGVY